MLLSICHFLFDLFNTGLTGGSLVKNLPAKQETRVQSLGQEDALEKEIASISSILAWKIPLTEEPGRLQSMGLQRIWHDLVTKQQQQQQFDLFNLAEELTHWKRLWCWEGLAARGEGDDRGWDGWMASLTRWTWVWVNSGSWWWTGRPGVLRFMGSQRAGHDWAPI